MNSIALLQSQPDAIVDDPAAVLANFRLYSPVDQHSYPTLATSTLTWSLTISVALVYGVIRAFARLVAPTSPFLLDLFASCRFLSAVWSSEFGIVTKGFTVENKYLALADRSGFGSGSASAPRGDDVPFALSYG